MPSPSRATTPSVRGRAPQPNRGQSPKFQGTRPVTRSGAGRGAAVSVTAAGSDFASRLRATQRTLRSRLERRDALIEMVRGVGATIEPAGIADFLITHAATWLPAPCIGIAALDLDGQPVMLASRGTVSDLEPALFNVARWVIERGDEFVTADLRHDARVAGLAGSVFGLPLTCRARRAAAIVAIDRERSSAEPALPPAILRGIYQLLEPAAMALDSALLLKRSEALTITDDLTSLYNSRHLTHVLRHEVKRAGRSRRPLSLLFIDLDGFKGVNDVHGHLCGSQALVEAADVIRRSARETDFAARYGGDEFALILPDTPANGARAVAERIRERIAEHRFLTSVGLSVRLTASVGIATLPDAAETPETLIHAADAAMYRVKNRGKNGIEAAGPPADKS
jgi:diguanylate cyclase (GGDEF)-like protein